jgi:hypothetical protein
MTTLIERAAIVVARNFITDLLGNGPSMKTVVRGSGSGHICVTAGGKP